MTMLNIVESLMLLGALILELLPAIIIFCIIYRIIRKKLWPYIKQLLDDVHTLAEEARKKEP